MKKQVKITSILLKERKNYKKKEKLKGKFEK